MKRQPFHITIISLRWIIWILATAALIPNSFAQQQLGFQILKETKHDPNSFTQGLALRGDWLIESSGLYGKSFATIYHAQSGAPRTRFKLPQNQFAEGLTYYDEKIYLLTWRAGILHVLDAAYLKTLRTIEYDGDGWGLTHDGKQFIMSNGSHELLFRDSQSFAITGRISVNNGRQRYANLNELEYAHNAIWANIWHSNKVIKIDPNSGKVLGELDLTQLVTPNQNGDLEAVLNGIAYDDQQDAFWVTGKRWSKRYLIKVDMPRQK